MAAIRVDFLSLEVLSAGAVPFTVHLDCWRATLRLVAPDFDNVSKQWRIDGLSVVRMFGTDSSGILESAVVPWQLGGLVVGGRPVNLNRELRFSPGTGVNPIRGFVALEYFDPQLPDPQSPL